MTPDLKADLLDALEIADRPDHVLTTEEKNTLRARVKAATITEPVGAVDARSFDERVRSLLLDIVEKGTPDNPCQAQEAKRLLQEMQPPPDPCVVECGDIKTQRAGVVLQVIEDDRVVQLLRDEAAALIPALQAFVREGGQQ